MKEAEKRWEVERDLVTAVKEQVAVAKEQLEEQQNKADDEVRQLSAGERETEREGRGAEVGLGERGGRR